MSAPDDDKPKGSEQDEALENPAKETPTAKAAGNAGASTGGSAEQKPASDVDEPTPAAPSGSEQAQAEAKSAQATASASAPDPAGGDKPAAVTKGAFAKAKPTARVKAQEGPDAWDRAGEWLFKHGPLPAVAAITIAIFAIHFHIFAGETAGDDLTFHFAEAARLADCIRVGDFDFWNPSANGGYASAYYYQVIPQLASALPAAIFGHHLFWFELSVVLPIVLAPACAYRAMRLFGATPWQSVVAAFCVAFMNGESRWGAGNAGTFNVGLYTQTWALCFFPLALAHGARWLSEGKSLAAAIGWGAFVFFCHPFAGVALGFAILAAWFAQVVLAGVDWLLAPAGMSQAGAAKALKGRAGWLDHVVTRWEHPPKRAIVPELWRGAILAFAFVITWLPVIVPLIVDKEGFGGFPHRVADEVGPGWKGLGKWYIKGAILDWLDPKISVRLALMTFTLPVILILARAKFYRWLWAPAFVYALMLGLGPSIGKIGDDLFPPVRFLGAMQTVLAMGIGAGVIILGTHLWRLADKLPRSAYTIRTGLAAAAAAGIVLVAVPGSRALSGRVRVLGDGANNRRAELLEINAHLAKLPQARKMAGPGAENHWWNLLPYAYERVPALLQMGGGGLQASPNYDFLWTNRDYVKNAWVFDAPYLVFMTTQGSKMPAGETIVKTANYEIRKLPAPGIVSPVHVTGVLPPGYSHKELGHKKALEWIKSEAPLKNEVLAYEGFTGNTDPPAGKTLRSWRQDSPGDDADIVAEVEVEKLTTFTVRESWHPRWRAYLDGEPIAVRRVTPDFPAIDIPPGKHTLEMRFERPWWAHAAWLSWPLVTIAAWWFMRRRKRRLPAH